jgi:hypothetical protein
MIRRFAFVALALSGLAGASAAAHADDATSQTIWKRYWMAIEVERNCNNVAFSQGQYDAMTKVIDTRIDYDLVRASAISSSPMPRPRPTTSPSNTAARIPARWICSLSTTPTSPPSPNSHAGACPEGDMLPDAEQPTSRFCGSVGKPRSLNRHPWASHGPVGEGNPIPLS